MVMQSEFVAHWANEKKLVFVGDGDSIAVCVAYLRIQDVISYGPSEITVLDFDERVVNSIVRFADREGLTTLSAHLYNCIDATPTLGNQDFFYTNPPWGASNAGESINVFVQRGIELIGGCGEGLVVLADRDPELPWTAETLSNVQRYAASKEFYVARLMPHLHSYHLDDNPELRSCNLILRSVSSVSRELVSGAITDEARLGHFYGDGAYPTVRYIRERMRVDYGKAHDDEYELEPWP